MFLTVFQFIGGLFAPEFFAPEISRARLWYHAQRDFAVIPATRDDYEARRKIEFGTWECFSVSNFVQLCDGRSELVRRGSDLTLDPEYRMGGSADQLTARPASSGRWGASGAAQLGPCQVAK